MTAAITPVVAAVLVAAGSGERLGAGVPKAFVVVAGRTLLAHAHQTFSDHPGVRDLVVVVPAGAEIDPRIVALSGGGTRREVVGGATRQQSVSAGLAVLSADVDLVLVHDVARPFVPDAVIDAVIAAVVGGADAAIPVVPVVDTVRRIGPDGSFAGVVDRSTLVAIQTPQGFRRSVLVAAHESGRDLAVTDDAALVEAAGGVVVPVTGSDESFKITTPADLARAAALARLRSQSSAH